MEKCWTTVKDNIIPGKRVKVELITPRKVMERQLWLIQKMKKADAEEFVHDFLKGKML